VNLQNYQTLVFDCDGVVLNSNKVKTQAFYNAALPYGEPAARLLVDYHLAHGGISRYKKFELFLEAMVPKSHAGPSLEDLLHAYATEVRLGLLTCEVAPGLDRLREQTRHAKWLIVSGGDQLELRNVFIDRGLVDLFDGGIFGSPDTKDTVLERECDRQNIVTPGLFLGDSRYDHVAASRIGLDFIFLSQWSEFSDWQSYCSEHALPALGSVSDLLA
jgi:phosphoglycolate phosphatase-like HAD superfamily hydrolase